MNGKKAKQLRYLFRTFEIPEILHKSMKKGYYKIPRPHRTYDKLDYFMRKFAISFHERVENVKKARQNASET
jgi:hypothetical protein